MLFVGQHFHVRCVHILNIFVQDGIKPIHGALELIRDQVRHINSSPARIHTFNAIANRMGLPMKSGLALDDLNSWNSSYEMIAEALKYKAILNRYAEEELGVNRSWSSIDIWK